MYRFEQRLAYMDKTQIFGCINKFYHNGTGKLLKPLCLVAWLFPDKPHESIPIIGAGYCICLNFLFPVSLIKRPLSLNFFIYIVNSAYECQIH
jgi:hypothetical protein